MHISTHFVAVLPDAVVCLAKMSVCLPAALYIYIYLHIYIFVFFNHQCTDPVGGKLRPDRLLRFQYTNGNREE